MKISFLKYSAILVFGLIWQVSCFNNAERTNPLDPKSDNFKNVGSVTGQALTFYVPFNAIPDVEIRMEPGTFVTKSDADGEFQFNNVPVGRRSISAQKEGFVTLVDSIDVQLGRSTSVQLHLDGLPIISSFSVISCHISRWWPQSDLFLLEVMAELQDLDGVNDIALVLFEIPDMNFLDTLQVTQSSGVFTTRISESQLPEGNLQVVLGRELLIKAVDRAGCENSSQPKFLARIIEQEPRFESPAGDSLDVSKPLLKWIPIRLSFNFTYKVEVFRVNEGFSSIVESITNIDPSVSSITVSEALPSGVYFWTVSVIDEFGNWSRSKEASFVIK
ncbi:MAG: carboxypeptidase regulatory-like domain-containing protein [bacterium]